MWNGRCRPIVTRPILEVEVVEEVDRGEEGEEGDTTAVTAPRMEGDDTVVPEEAEECVVVRHGEEEAVGTGEKERMLHDYQYYLLFNRMIEKVRVRVFGRIV